MTSPINRKSSEWCYENTAGLLADQFNNSWIWIIEPSSMHDHIFSRYDNFVHGNLLGAPESFDNHGALQHLKELLKAGVDLVNHHLEGQEHEQVARLDNDDEVSQSSALDQNSISSSVQVQCQVKHDLPLVLVGFSKGCVVLNQFLHELADVESSTTPELKNFVGSISAWYWLDGGHSKETNTWITDEDVLVELATLKTKINVHVTPYQMSDPSRPYIGEEERVFVDTLKRLGADVTETLHFDGQTRSLKIHFRVLERIFDTECNPINFPAQFDKK